MRRSLQPLGVLAVLTFALFACQTSVDLPAHWPQAEAVQRSSAGESAAVQAPELASLQDALINIYEQANPGVAALRLLERDGGSQGSGLSSTGRTYRHQLSRGRYLDGAGGGFRLRI
jgi:hypothetical protein